MDVTRWHPKSRCDHYCNCRIPTNFAGNEKLNHSFSFFTISFIYLIRHNHHEGIMRRIQVVIEDNAHDVLEEYMKEHDYPNKDLALQNLLLEAKHWMIQK